MNHIFMFPNSTCSPIPFVTSSTTTEDIHTYSIHILFVLSVAIIVIFIFLIPHEKLQEFDSYPVDCVIEFPIS